MKFPLSRQLLKDIKNTPQVVRQNTEAAVAISVVALCFAFIAFMVVASRKDS
jgi:hypothetical protein